MADIFLICVIVVAFFILSVIGLYLVVKYQHPDDKNDAYFPKLIVLLGFVLAGGTVFLLPLDVANNSNFAGEYMVMWCWEASEIFFPLRVLFFTCQFCTHLT